MKNVQVRCWQILVSHPHNEINDILFITYPEDNWGHELITCLNCGELYAVDVSKKVYMSPPLEQKLSLLNCLQCNEKLATNFAYYPETYRSKNGDIREFKREDIIPSDKNSILKIFLSVYDD